MKYIAWARAKLPWIRFSFLLASDLIVRLAPRRSADLAIIVRLDAIGDFVLWLQSGAADITAHLRGRSARVVLLASTSVAPLAESLGLWDQVVTIDTIRFQRNVRYRIVTMLAIRKMGARTLIQPRVFRTFVVEDRITWCCGAKERVGSTSRPVNMSPLLLSFASRYYSRLLPQRVGLKAHELERNREFVKGLGAAVSEPVRPNFSGVAHCQLLPSGSYAVLALGAGWSGRRWPIRRFATCVEALRSVGLGCVIVGDASDRALADELQTGIQGPLVDLTGRLSLLESCLVVSRALLVVCNESAMLHVSAWVGTPVVSIVGGGHFSMFAPYPDRYKGKAPNVSVFFEMPCYGCNWKCIYGVRNGPVPCVENVSEQQLITALMEILSFAGMAQGAPMVSVNHERAGP